MKTCKQNLYQLRENCLDHFTTAYTLLSNDSVYARIGTVDSGENRIGKSFKMAALYQKRVDTFPKLG